MAVQPFHWGCCFRWSFVFNRRKESVRNFLANEEFAVKSPSVRLTRYDFLPPLEIEGDRMESQDTKNPNTIESEKVLTRVNSTLKRVFEKNKSSLPRFVECTPGEYKTLPEVGTAPSDTTSADNQNKREDTRNESEEALYRQQFVLHELIVSEENYIRELNVVQRYTKIISSLNLAAFSVPAPFDLQTTSPLNKLFRSVLVNVEKICEWHEKTFLPALKECLHQPKCLYGVFEKFNTVFEMYERYFKKKDIIDFIVMKHGYYFEEIRQLMTSPYDVSLSSVLMLPLRRIINYNVLLKELLRCAEIANLHDQWEPLQNATDDMSKFVHNIKNVIELSKLCNFNGDLEIQGELLMHGPMKCAERLTSDQHTNDIYRDIYVFLFECSMIFTVKVAKQNNTNESYFYKDYIPLHDANIESLCESFDGSFVIRFSSDSSQRWYVCRPAFNEKRFNWIKTIRNLLENRKQFQEALMNPQQYNAKHYSKFYSSERMT